MPYHWIDRLSGVVFAVALITVAQYLPAFEERVMYASIAALKGCGL